MSSNFGHKFEETWPDRHKEKGKTIWKHHKRPETIHNPGEMWTLRQLIRVMMSTMIYPTKSSDKDKDNGKDKSTSETPSKGELGHVCPSELRDRWGHQNGWIFRKVPNCIWPPPPHFQKIILRILRQNCDKSGYVHYGGTVVYYMILFPMRCM